MVMPVSSSACAYYLLRVLERVAPMLSSDASS